uniref:Repressor protein n=1 Tax=Dulem virus 35 TaxID=3145753 RepID=A0AAU8AZH8_9CAUD
MLEKIIELCKENHISISKLEKECGFGNATIRGWKESNPNVANLKKVADYFGKPLEYFLE